MMRRTWKKQKMRTDRGKIQKKKENSQTGQGDKVRNQIFIERQKRDRTKEWKIRQTYCTKKEYTEDLQLSVDWIKVAPANLYKILYFHAVYSSREKKNRVKAFTLPALPSKPGFTKCHLFDLSWDQTPTKIESSQSISLEGIQNTVNMCTVVWQKTSLCSGNKIQLSLRQRIDHLVTVPCFFLSTLPHFTVDDWGAVNGLHDCSQAACTDRGESSSLGGAPSGPPFLQNSPGLWAGIHWAFPEQNLIIQTTDKHEQHELRI